MTAGERHCALADHCQFEFAVDWGRHKTEKDIDTNDDTQISDLHNVFFGEDGVLRSHADLVELSSFVEVSSSAPPRASSSSKQRFDKDLVA